MSATAKDTILVLSGCLYSTTMLYEFRQRIALAVTFDYGSNHNAREIECAAYNCRKLGVPHLVIPLGFIGRYFESSLLSGGDAVPTGHYDGENLRSTVVPFRNGIMLAVAAGLAESRGLAKVMIANHAGDHEIYPDCRPGFVKAMGEAISEGTFAPVVLDAPYTGLTKADIALRGLRLGLDYDHTYSCYKGGEKPCGECATCVEREEALAQAHKMLRACLKINVK